MINRVVLVGRLTRDPELKKTNSGTSLVNFTIAVDNRGSKNAEGNKTASFIPCVVFQNSADILFKFTKKGSLVGVEGRLNQRSFTRQDGTKASAIEVLVDSISLLEPKGNSDSQDDMQNLIDAPSLDEGKNLDSIDMPDDDLPF